MLILKGDFAVYCLKQKSKKGYIGILSNAGEMTKVQTRTFLHSSEHLRREMKRNYWPKIVQSVRFFRESF